MSSYQRRLEGYTPRVRHALTDFMSACEAGERPDSDDYLLRCVTDSERSCLEFRIGQYLDDHVGDDVDLDDAVSDDAEYIGPYRLLELMAIGGQAAVYRAIDDELNREVALKVPMTYSLSNQRSCRREGKILARLDHSGIVSVFRSAADGEDHYIASQFIEGERLDSLIGRFEIEQAVVLVAKIADILHYAHEQGVIHRDVKPDNIIVRDGEPYILDFGVAHASFEETVFANEGRLGSALYASPEHAREKGFDRRSDIFSLGIILYQLLTRETPFKVGSQPIDFQHVLEQEVNPPSQYRTLPDGLEAVCLRALERHPDDRFQTAEEFARALRQVGNRPSRRRRLLAALVTIVMAALCVTLGAQRLLGLAVTKEKQSVPPTPQGTVQAFWAPTVPVHVTGPGKGQVAWFRCDRGNPMTNASATALLGETVHVAPGEYLLQWINKRNACYAMRTIGGKSLGWRYMWSRWNAADNRFEVKPLKVGRKRPKMVLHGNLLVSECILIKDFKVENPRPYAEQLKKKFESGPLAAVSFDEAMQYAELLGCRLLSLEEFEKLGIQSPLPEWTATWGPKTRVGDVRVVRDGRQGTQLQRTHTTRNCFRVACYEKPLPTAR